MHSASPWQCEMAAKLSFEAAREVPRGISMLRSGLEIGHPSPWLHTERGPHMLVAKACLSWQPGCEYFNG